jgi:isoquinoline 1-oxidoreductase subunit beta
MTFQQRQGDGETRRQGESIYNCEELNYDELLEPIQFRFAVDRRAFVQTLGAGVLVSAFGLRVAAQRQRRGRGGFLGGPPAPLTARFHFADDGTITIFSGKVDAGQGARNELSQVAADTLRLPMGQVRVVLGDTALCPNDGITAGSGTTPRTVPAIRQAADALRKLLVDTAAKKWQVEPGTVDALGGKVVHKVTNREISYLDAVKASDSAKEFTDVRPAVPKGAANIATAKVLGRHRYPSDMKRPGMLYGCVLRAPKYRATLLEVDLSPAEAMEGVIAVRDGDFAGVVAPTVFAAHQAIEVVAKTAKWSDVSLPSSGELFKYLRAHADVPANPAADEVKKASKSLRATYTIAYVQHAPLEPRAALAEWNDGKVTVWTGTQNPFGVRGELMQAFRLAEKDVRVIVSDFGSGYGGKHMGEMAVEAARLAKAAKKPVMLRWTREEEFTYAYFRPAAVIDVEASFGNADKLATWYQVNINAGRNSVESPYDIGKKNSYSVGSRAPLRHGSYRALAATGNTFARESFMDELAAHVKADPLSFRLAHLSDSRLRDVLQDAAKRFRWAKRVENEQPNRGVGLACGTEKGSFVACCAEVEVDRAANEIKVRDVCQVFDCGPILNPENLANQMEGAIVMGLGPALREEILFENGAVKNASFRHYRVPRFADVPSITAQAINRSNVPPAGAGETPIIAIAPAIGNAVFRATGVRLRSMPMKLSASNA